MPDAGKKLEVRGLKSEVGSRKEKSKEEIGKRKTG